MTTRKEKKQIWMDGWKKKKMKNDEVTAIMRAINIPHIYEAIFEDQSDLRRMMELRRISKSFNLFFIHRIYELFKTTKITTENDDILIHGVTLKLSLNKKEDQLFPFMTFLRDNIHVEPKKLELVDLAAVDESNHKHVHDGIITMFGGQATQLTELTGLAEICEFGCEKCNKLAKHCTVYEPITVYDIVHGFGGVIHNLKEIKFSDRELFHCAQKLMDVGDPINISKDISCDHFILTIIEGQTRYLFYRKKEKAQQGVPIGVLNRILENLSPKTLEIKISEAKEPGEIRQNWYKSGYFTEVRMGMPVPRNAVLSRIFKNFHLDVTDSRNFPREIETPQILYGDISKISNVLFLVKAENYSVTLPRNFLEFSHLDSNFGIILESVWSGNSMHQKVDIHFFPSIRHLGLGGTEYSGMVKYQGVKLPVKLEDVQLKMNKDAPENPFKEQNFIGKKFSIRNADTNCDVNIFCWVEREPYHKCYYTNQEPQVVIPVWFLDGEHGPNCVICHPPRPPQRNGLIELLLQHFINPNENARDVLPIMEVLARNDQEPVEPRAPEPHGIRRRLENRQNHGLPMRMGRRFN